jgi:hypothetical protein
VLCYLKVCHILVVNSDKLDVVQTTVDSIIPNTATPVDRIASNGDLDAELQKAKRNEVIMTQFARAFWKTLKLYKDKILVCSFFIIILRVGIH